MVICSLTSEIFDEWLFLNEVILFIYFFPECENDSLDIVNMCLRLMIWVSVNMKLQS